MSDLQDFGVSCHRRTIRYAAVIVGIPLNPSGGADSWYWVAEKNGFYSVRSAYNLLEKNLCIKKVLVENTCPFCGVFAETERHILVSCNFAWSCWEYAGLAAVNREASSLGLWLADMFRLLNGESQGRVRSRSVKDVVTFASSSLDHWLKAQGKGNIPLLSPLEDRDGSELWIKSSVGIKLNVDAAIFDLSSKHGFGCVVRNANGDLVAAFAGVKHGKMSPDLAEIMRISEPLSWLKNHAYTQAIVETESLVCAEAIRNAEVFVSSFGLVVEDCKKILDSLINVSLLFVKRSANCVAHFVARHSISLAEHMFSINSVPMELMSILTSDCSS
ncbi:hypothetical protein CsatA_009577 [Cannabis sativa]